jgi:HSP20 family protein
MSLGTSDHARLDYCRPFNLPLSAGAVMSKDFLSYVHYLSSQSAPWKETHWQPAVDVYDTPDGWLVKVELAGVRIEDVEVLASGRSLTIRGVRYDWSIDEVRHSYSLEIAYNRFERTLRLPCEIDPHEIKTEYRDGMLLIRIPECRNA